MKLTDHQQRKLADLICEVLTKVYVTNPARFKQEADDLNATMEQFAAMAIAQMIAEFLEGRVGNGNGQNS